MTNSQRDKAELFQSLHMREPVLVLANAWDVVSARIVESAGATAIATTSAAVAWSLGAPDGDAVDRDRALEVIARIAAAVDTPVTADIENGYAEAPAGVALTIEAVLAAGAVGVNLEDARYDGGGPLRDPADQAARIAAARAAADSADIPLYINARIDTYLRSVGDPSERLQHTLDRAASYLAAGASGIFVPGVGDRATVEALAAGIAAPLNVLAGPGSLPVAELAALGVARVSLGSSMAAAAYALVARASREAFTSGTYASIEGALGYGELNALVAK